MKHLYKSLENFIFNYRITEIWIVIFNSFHVCETLVPCRHRQWKNFVDSIVTQYTAGIEDAYLF